MVIVKLNGGMGNQMFQYALGRHVAYANKVELKLDISVFERYDLRQYGLRQFNIHEQFATATEIAFFTKRQRRHGIFSFLHNLFVADISIYVEEPSFPFNHEILKSRSPVYLDGYWQSEKYFKDIESIIRKDFSLQSEISGANAEIALEIEQTDSVSLHVRRGDYVTVKKTNKVHGTCSTEYYQQAVATIAQNTNNPCFFVFSDDIPWARENITLKYCTIYVGHNDAATNYEDLRLMSLCKHNIVANSSFSWWGAWLNNNTQKIVIAPQRWFATDKLDYRDLVPGTWIKL